ncbi:hypothetical protein ACM39_01790 [Chryseobacterium sp. FH2]|uniref:hypothetical protein n=1 Tax=Chryseobacterium sp. FH2 TaxID=1674291 RepID=UPI00065AF26F|nr:hypothetical protein [Chryseobacterium sp. FH2]KMQ69803.1 hypothetical protein ACM39_01790 [Chryseobacterium sp. FH2]
MKKIILLASLFGITGIMMNAKDLVESKPEIEKETITFKLPAQWIQCIAPCGAVYWLQASNYNTVAEFLDAQQDFNDIKC